MTQLKEFETKVLGKFEFERDMILGEEKKRDR